MLSVREAADRAAEFARALLDDARRNDLRLEEVEKRGSQWLITLSMPSNHPLGALSGHRDYKAFTVDTETGEVVSMKIRELAGAS